MVAVDSALAPSGDVHEKTVFAGPIVLLALLGAALLAAGTLLFEMKNNFAWSDAAENVSRFSLLVFVAAMVVEPLSRIFPTKVTEALARERGSLVLAFVIVSVVSLACDLAPSQLDGEKLGLQAFAYAMLTAGILLVTLFSAHPATKKILGGPVWRTMQRIATTYFWLVFTVTALDHIAGPNVTDRWWGISLLLLITAVLVRFTGTLLYKLRPTPASEKAA
ncbi:MAG: hypothetical protein ISS15_02045 [Alphaproteobacteria bacterium]|nr:hypothetical protein [Alphaproteobacteria bacterium]MBL7096413.1 hypothetical protein [Alphaproteobacteria bacterium]